ncbi:MAG: hypothetical protein ACLUKN_12835 [Bacilli bacterium]
MSQRDRGMGACSRENYWALLVGKRPDGRKSLQGFPSEKNSSAIWTKRELNAIIQGWYWQN